MAEFYENLKAESLAPVYILVSSEPLLIDRATSAIRNAAVPEALRGFNVDHMDGKGATAERILLTAKTLPMMSDRRLLIVRGLELLPAGELKTLAPYLDAPNPSTVLLATCTKIDKRIKFFQRAKKLKMLFDLSAPKRLGPWIAREATQRSVQLSRAAADRLADVVGSDLSRLGLALTQLSLFAPDREITADDVDELIADTRERSVFELTDAIASRNTLKAMKAMAGLFEQRQSSIGVVMMLARNMRQVALFQDGTQKRLSRGDLAKRVGVAPFMLDRLAGQAQRYSVRALATSMQMLAEADRALKGFEQSSKVLGKPLAERIIVETLVQSLIELAN